MTVSKEGGNKGSNASDQDRDLGTPGGESQRSGGGIGQQGGNATSGNRGAERGGSSQSAVPGNPNRGTELDDEQRDLGTEDDDSVTGNLAGGAANPGNQQSGMATSGTPGSSGMRGTQDTSGIQSTQGTAGRSQATRAGDSDSASGSGATPTAGTTGRSR